MRWNACALSLGLMAASYLGTVVNPIGAYIGVVVGAYLFASTCA